MVLPHGIPSDSYSAQGPWLGAVVQACNPSPLGGQGRQTILANMVKPCPTKNTKTNWAWQQVPVVPATWEAEAGELLEPGGRGCSGPRARHRTPAW